MYKQTINTWKHKSCSTSNANQNYNDNWAQSSQERGSRCLWVQSQPDLFYKLQPSQDYIMRPYLEKISIIYNLMPIHGHSTTNNKWNLISVGEYLGKLKYSFSKHKFAYNSEILLLGMCLRKMKTHVNTKTGAWMVIETL